jgi:sRNA-binding regulator protein Hfq
MDEVGSVRFGQDINQLAEAIRDISKQLQSLQQMSSEEAEKLEKYIAENDSLELILVTGGLIKGKILWTGNQSFGVKTDSDQEVIVYKHAVAFIQK